MTQNLTEDGEALAKMAHQALCTLGPASPRMSKDLRERGLFYRQKSLDHVQDTPQTPGQEEGSSDPVPPAIDISQRQVPRPASFQCPQIQAWLGWSIDLEL